MKRLFLVAGATLCFASGAHASITPTLASVTPDGSDFLFNYTVTLSSDEGLTNGSELVIMDFAGYVPGSIVSPSANIAASVAGLANFNTSAGGVQANPMFTDNPNVPDLIFTYHGPDLQTTNGPAAAPTVLIDFTAESTISGVTPGGFSSRGISNSGVGTVGMASFNNGAVGVPTAQVSTTPLPEPTSWALLIVGFGGVGGLLRDKRRHQAQALV